MPELCRFYGICIRMYFDDHYPPHFHATYGGSEVLININTLAIIFGNLPPRAMGLVMEWASLRQKEIIIEWNKAKNLEPIGKIEPLH